MEDYTREEHVLGRDARKRGASLGHHLSELLRINKYNRMVRAQREQKVTQIRKLSIQMHWTRNIYADKHGEHTTC